MYEKPIQVILPHKKKLDLNSSQDAAVALLRYWFLAGKTRRGAARKI
jgi:hypothetical protein